MSIIKHEVHSVGKDTIAKEMGISKGDFLISINGKQVVDVLDYRFATAEEVLLVEIEKPSGEIWELDIEKDADEDLGIVFKQSLMSGGKRCHNKCIFCFVDQQPKGLRPSLYVKDDDARLSFLMGNYVTLTNLSMEEVHRLASYHLSPLRISVHAADLDLREKMMGTKKARNLFDALAVFNDAGIDMHFQIVLCKGVNDGDMLTQTINKLAEITPGARSLAIVPAGLTKHRDGLYPLSVFGKEDAAAVVRQVEQLRESLENERDIVKSMRNGPDGETPENAKRAFSGASVTRGKADFELFHYKSCNTSQALHEPDNSPAVSFEGGMHISLSDEWYVLSGLPLPKYAEYGDFHQLDNGVGMLRLFERQFLRGLKAIEKSKASVNNKNAKKKFCTNHRQITIATGMAASKFMQSIAERFMQKHTDIKITIVPIENNFFGKTVTVSGLLTGVDIIAQLRDKLPKASLLFLPENAFRSGVKEKIMLDGTTLVQLEAALSVRVVIGSGHGGKFARQLVRT